MKELKITLVLLMASCCTIMAQQDAQYTQYMYNTQVVNPAYAGSRGVFSAAVLYRSQWIGLDGAPTTQTLNMNTPLTKRLGAGFSIVNDDIGNGTNQNTYFNIDFSYTIPTSQTGNLSFGLKAGGHLLDVNLANLRHFNPGILSPDENNIDKRFSPNFGAGIYYYTNQFYAGFSVPNFLQTQHFEISEGSNSYVTEGRKTYYLIMGYVAHLNSWLKLKPAVLVRTTSSAPIQVDLSATFLYKNKVSLGAAYRVDAAASVLAGFQINDKFMLGMAYDKETTDFGGTQFNNGSFEFILRYELKSKRRNTISPRFF